MLRNTIGAMVVAHIAWEVPFLLTTLLSGANSIPPLTGNLGDQVLSLTRTGNHLIVSYLPASRFWTLQVIDAGVFLAVAAAALGTAIWLLHRRTT